MITVRAYRGPVTGWVRPWLQAAEIAVSAPVVIGIRTVGMVRGGWPPSAKARREYSRMVREKAEGFTRAAVVAVTTPPRDTARSAAAVLAPVHRRVVANRRRLGGW